MEEPTKARPAFKDPKPSVERISQLAQRVLTGDILLPKFQREFVWQNDQILRLLDSIARNYPIGGILLWQSREPLASERTIADLEIAGSKPDYPVNYLLDGQQRLSTVCGALFWKPSDPKSRWNVVYDLKTEEFAHLDTLDDPPLSQIPVRYLSDPSLFFRRSTALEDSMLQERANALFNRFADYMITAVTLGDMSINDIAPVFERINSSGTPLTIVDLMRAATWSTDFDLHDSITEVLNVAARKNFGAVDRKTILRAVAAAAGFGFAVDDIDKLRNKSATELQDIFDKVTEAVKRAVDFLATHIRIPSPHALPYGNQFAVLTEIFRQVPSPTAAESAAIQRWFWHSTLSAYFGGWNTGDMSRDSQAISNFASGKTPELAVPKALPTVDIWLTTQFRTNSAVSKMMGIILSYHNPVDLITNQRLDPGKSLAWSNDKEYHHFFPRAYLKDKGVPADAINAVANIVMLSSASNIKISDKAPSVYLGALIEELGEAEVRSRAASLLVTQDAFDAALADDFNRFLLARAATLHSVALGLVNTSDSKTEQA